MNVFLGDMTLVGPRPESPEITARYNKEQRLVLSVKPGVTGPVQLEWTDEAETIPEGERGQQYYIDYLMDRKIQVDLNYLTARTFFTDTGIVWQTTTLVFSRLLTSLFRSEQTRERPLPGPSELKQSEPQGGKW
ncbi:MAG: hypothetical protein NVS9B4_15800 [Candidatus Acidiferrum sp.]